MTMKMITVLVPREQVERLDEAIKGQYPNRSNAIRDFIRQYLKESASATRKETS